MLNSVYPDEIACYDEMVSRLDLHVHVVCTLICRSEKKYIMYSITTEAALQNFNVQINKAIPGYDDLILTGQAIDDCAASCKNQEEWVCNSFEYCFDTGYCVLSKLHPDERPGIVQNKPLCDLYSRK